MSDSARSAAEFYVPSIDLELVERYDEVVKYTWEALTPLGELRCAAEAEMLGVRLLGSRALHRRVSNIERSVDEADVLIALSVLHDEGVVDLGPSAVASMASWGIPVSPCP